MDNPNAAGIEGQEPAAALRPKILAVDDEREIVDMLAIGLRTNGYAVSVATNGREAVDKVRSEKPDLIVMDVMMPEMNGFQALRLLKEDQETAHIPIILLTARIAQSDVLNGWLRGADLYMTKPYSMFELIANIKHMLADNAQDDDEFFATL